MSIQNTTSIKAKSTNATNKARQGTKEECDFERQLEELPEHSKRSSPADGLTDVQLDASLFEDLKAFSRLHDIPCLTLIHETLVRYVEEEKGKLVGRQCVQASQFSNSLRENESENNNGYLTLGWYHR